MYPKLGLYCLNILEGVKMRVISASGKLFDQNIKKNGHKARIFLLVDLRTLLL